MVRTRVIRTVAGGGGGAITGLDFPGFTDGVYSPLFGWRATHGTVAPFARSPGTYIWRVLPRSQPTHYHSQFFRTQWLDIWDDGGTYRYVGFTIYITENWEITASAIDTLGITVDFGRWHTCVAIINGLNYTFYADWPDTTTNVITVTETNATEPTDAWLGTGDAPWSRGNEVMDGIIRGFQYYDAVLSLANIADEVATPGSFRTPWYLNLNPTVADISDKSGNSNHPAWVGADRPFDWTGP